MIRTIFWLIFAPVIIVVATPILVLFGRRPLPQEMVVDAVLEEDES